MTSRCSILFLLCLALAAPLSAQDAPSGKFSGLIFGDYFYKIRGDSTGGGSQYAPLRKDQQAFQFRRFYLFYDYTISQTFAAQFLLEANDKAFTDGKHGVFLKTAYVEWRNILPFANLSLGLIPTPSWVPVTEKTWAYRSIEKTIADFRGLGVATDIGVGLRGKFSEEGTLSYMAMIGNGSGQKPESNKYKKYYGSLLYKPAPEIFLEAYADHEPAGGGRSTTTVKGFAAYQSESAAAGVEVVRQQLTQGGGAAGADRVPFGFALFARARIPGTADLGAFARYDRFDPDTKSPGAGYTEHFFTAGLDVVPVKDLHLMPNIWVNAYADKGASGAAPDADVVGRVTFFLVFK